MAPAMLPPFFPKDVCSRHHCQSARMLAQTFAAVALPKIANITDLQVQIVDQRSEITALQSTIDQLNTTVHNFLAAMEDGNSKSKGTKSDNIMESEQSKNKSRRLMSRGLMSRRPMSRQ
mmetsp:Transcript_18892/g.41169  ORF Transcript_18892/g.41169 Transcript_18892/m.41169 type:complete len:119 (+) Transcript_18892:214-570(+)